MSLFTIAYFALAIIIIIWIFSKWSYSYWTRMGLENPEPEFIFGNTKDYIMRKVSYGGQFKIIYDELKARGLKHGGCYLSFKPVYMPTDLEFIKNIMQRDFNHFVNHGVYFNEKADPLTGHLFSLEDDNWRKLRTKLTPTFTSGKLKRMFYTLVSCTSGLHSILKDHSNMQDAVDIKSIVSRFTTDVIGSVAFGLDCNSLKNPDSEFRKYGKQFFKIDFIQRMKYIISQVVPKHILVMLGFKITPRDVEEFFLNVVKSTVQYRESNNIHRKDFMHLLLQLRNRGEIAEDENIFGNEISAKSKEFMSINEMAAQCFVFFVAGYESSASTMTFALLELALNQDIQDTLRKEIKTMMKKHDGQVTYDAIMSMSYLDKVIHETLRKHTPVPAMQRVCTKAYKVPDTDVVLEVGTVVLLPFHAIHHDPEHYPDPKKFDPERFNEENKAKRHTLAFLPFGEGPRVCIEEILSISRKELEVGLCIKSPIKGVKESSTQRDLEGTGARFGLLQIKVGLTAIIGNFKMTLNDKTNIPIKYSTDGFVSTVEGGVWLNVTEIE